MYTPDYDTAWPIEERRAAKFRMEADRKNAKKAPAPAPDRVTVQPRPVDVSELPRTIYDVIKLLPGKTHARYAQTWHEGEVFKSGARQGEKRPDKIKDHYAIGNEELPLTAAWSDGTMLYAKVYLDGQVRWTKSVNELKAWLKGERA